MPHTPGPWRYDDYHEVLESDTGDVAHMAMTSESDASLIVAAPDLLAALEAIAIKRDPFQDGNRYCVECGEHGDPDDRVPLTHYADCIVGSAIKKALG